MERELRIPAAARAYVELGWAVVPVHMMRGGSCSCGRDTCAAPGKHPHVRWQRFQTLRPTVDQVAAWWRRWPDANVGVLTGPVSLLVVLDIDPRNGGNASLRAIEERWGAHAPTVESHTGGGGRHVWFRTGEPFPTRVIDRTCRRRSAITAQSACPA